MLKGWCRKSEKTLPPPPRPTKPHTPPPPPPARLYNNGKGDQRGATAAPEGENPGRPPCKSSLVWGGRGGRKRPKKRSASSRGRGAGGGGRGRAPMPTATATTPATRGYAKNRRKDGRRGKGDREKPNQNKKKKKKRSGCLGGGGGRGPAATKQGPKQGQIAALSPVASRGQEGEKGGGRRGGEGPGPQKNTPPADRGQKKSRARGGPARAKNTKKTPPRGPQPPRKEKGGGKKKKTPRHASTGDDVAPPFSQSEYGNKNHQPVKQSDGTLNGNAWAEDRVSAGQDKKIRRAIECLEIPVRMLSFQDQLGINQERTFVHGGSPVLEPTRERNQQNQNDDRGDGESLAVYRHVRSKREFVRLNGWPTSRHAARHFFPNNGIPAPSACHANQERTTRRPAYG